MRKELAKAYDPQAVESKIYKFWLDGNFFHAEPDPSRKPYTIVIPPPNITGQLHMGHAMDNTMQDILIRWRRMQGYCTLWMPGTDHASIATEAKIVAAMAKEGLTKEQIGREEFLKRAWAWREQYGSRIVEQLKRLGSSCDWAQERFTLDEGCSKAVNTVFTRLYEKGLIYRGERIINWCPHCRTSISDAEVEYEEKVGQFWHIKYPLEDGSGYLELATTRPETMLGDTAVAVHPDDERYKQLVGKNVILPIVNKPIPIVADEYVEMDFGTGVVKITPAHDPNDFEVGLRHNLPVINVMTDDGHINENGGKFEGMTAADARKAIVEELDSLGLLVRIEEIKHNVGTCYRCGTVIEPRVSTQWFVKMKPLAEPAIEAVRTGKTKFVPERFEKTYYNWMENIRDWCISRQLWWGHRIPAWYCDDCGEMVVSAEQPDVCPKCGKKHFTQDPDTLDTWFSSALWPFSTLGWPDETEELKYFYPTNTLVTGYDIIFFWVARMIFSGCEQMGETPFDTVLIHGLVRDAQGRKMSKSLGNGIDPLEVIDQYGADALRLMLMTGTSPGNDTRFIDEKVVAARNFANKIWNATRFILMNLTDDITDDRLPDEITAIEDKWLLTKWNRLVAEVTENLERFELGVAVGKLYDFTYDVFCDWYIELAKSRLQGEKADDARRMLVHVMVGILKLLHPFMPFVTEEIYGAIPHTPANPGVPYWSGDALMVSRWPEPDEAHIYPAEETDFERVMTAIKAIRNRRSEMNVPPSRKAQLFIETDFQAAFESGIPFFQRLAGVSEVSFTDAPEMEGTVSVITDSARLFIPMGELVDLEAERKRLQKELEKAEKELSGLNGKLSNPGFLNKAPANVVEAEKARAAALNEKIAKLRASL